MNENNDNSRRGFIKAAAAFGISGSALTFDAENKIAHAALPVGAPGTASVGQDYKAIVCVFNDGGQDDANILIPWLDGNSTGTGTATTFHEYTAYAHWRSNYKSTDAAKKVQSMRKMPTGSATPTTGNLSYARSGLPKFENGNDVTGALQLSQMTLPSSTTNFLTGTPDPTPGGWTTNTYGRQFALNPCYAELKGIYDAGRLAIIANVGPLLQKVNRHQYSAQRSTLKLPLNLYSHDDQQDAWMSATSAQANPDVGIGGRIANVPEIRELNRAGGLDSKVSTQISMFGNRTFMLVDSATVPSAIPYQMGTGSIGRLQTTTTTPPISPTVCNGSSSFMQANPTSPYCLIGGPVRLSSGYSGQSAMSAAVRARYSTTAEGVSIYHDQWRQVMRQSIDTEANIASAFLASPPEEDVLQPFVAVDTYNGSGNSLARQLRMVAAMIRASSQLGPNASQPIKRQIFFVGGAGGFDNHGDEFWRDTTTVNRRISLALNAFWTALGRIKIRDSAGNELPGNARDRVTTFSFSEFGRTLDSNGDGSDHGWGNVQFVMGGAVRGGRIFGQSHNVTDAQIPFDNSGTSGPKSRHMGVDTTAGAVPRIGLPPTGNEGNTGPAGKVKMLTQASGTVTNPPANPLLPNIPNTVTIHLNHSLSRGETIPTMASDAMIATIAKWFGVPDSAITGPAPGNYVFPTLHGVHGDNWDVGFMNPP